jgi:hypothetical protein
MRDPKHYERVREDDRWIKRKEVENKSLVFPRDSVEPTNEMLSQGRKDTFESRAYPCCACYS